jgi:AcrR family transcriptional regulator
MKETELNVSTAVQSDRRWRKTERELQRGLATLLNEKSLKEVSVRELADVADINRSTFYVHYHDIYDMVEQIGDHMLSEFKEAINSHDRECKEGNFTPMLVSVYNFLKKYGEFFSILMGKNGDTYFRVNFREIAREKLVEWFSIFTHSIEDPYFGYKCAFIVQGSIGLMQAWLERDMKETPEQIAKMTEDFVTSGIISD